MEHMSEKLVKVLEAEGDRIMAKAAERIISNRDDAIREMAAKVKEMTEAIENPPLRGITGVIELLEGGGVIRTFPVKVEYSEMRVELNIGNMSLIPYRDINLAKGEYRVTLIIEPKETQP